MPMLAEIFVIIIYISLLTECLQGCKGKFKQMKVFKSQSIANPC